MKINVLYRTNRIKDKDYIIISINAKKEKDNIQYFFMMHIQQTKSWRKVFQHIKNTYKKPTANIILVKIKSFSSKIRNKTRIPIVATSSQ